MARKDEKNLKRIVEQNLEFRKGCSSITEAGKYLERSGHLLTKFHFQNSDVRELEIWLRALTLKSKKYSHLIPDLKQQLESQKITETQKSKEQDARTLVEKKASLFSGLSARELLVEAEEMTEIQIKGLLSWEKNNKNRAIVIKGLQEMLTGTATEVVRSNASTSQTHQDFGPNPFAEENRKAYSRGRGTVRERCLDCGEINTVDVELLSQVTNRRTNSTKGRLDAWADRQIESGSRMTGRFGAAELARANRNNLAENVSRGFPCAYCGSPLLR